MAGNISAKPGSGQSAASTSNAPMPSSSSAGTRKKRGRSGRNKKRKKSFVPTIRDHHQEEIDDQQSTPQRAGSREVYAMPAANVSHTTVDSQVLLDRREPSPFLRPRRASTSANITATRHSQSSTKLPTLRRTATSGDDDEEYEINDRVPLLSSEATRHLSTPNFRTESYGTRDGALSSSRSRRDSQGSAPSKRRYAEQYNVNYPPSRPNTPPPDDPVDLGLLGSLVPLGAETHDDALGSQSAFPGRRVGGVSAEEDVCFPHDGMSEIAEEDARSGQLPRKIRKRRGKWPDLSHLDEWSRLEKIGEERRAKKITEPTLVNGRLRPAPGNKGWFRTAEEAPYRFTYFNEELQSTIHSHTLSELIPEGCTFKSLFIPDRPLLSDSEEEEEEDDEDDDDGDDRDPVAQVEASLPVISRVTSQSMFASGSRVGSEHGSKHGSKDGREGKEPTPDSHSQRRAETDSPPVDPQLGKLLHPKTQSLSVPGEKTLKYGERPVWWLDVFRPTDEEMKVLSKTFGIHPLTAEDIMLQEAREKVELFRHYYFVNYRTFDQDVGSATYLEPVNMAVIVFREGVLTFHFDPTPHAANVRRRIRQLSDYLSVSSDWISYAIIDDITDVFVPLIQNIEREVDEIDEAILRWHSDDPAPTSDGRKNGSEKKLDTESVVASSVSSEADGDMLRRVGDCRKRVMSLYRLLGNKADVIKGFAKRCNERWEIAPRSDIGLYLGDIQDHIVTMTSNVSHYEKILARSHANYLAQLNIRMSERQEQTADVLGKLTVLGTIVLPMNIVTGLWGMNVWVPGQEYQGDLKWFGFITTGLFAFGFVCYVIAKRVYGIV